MCGFFIFISLDLVHIWMEYQMVGEKVNLAKKNKKQKP
jgi:hypothetical protein